MNDHRTDRGTTRPTKPANPFPKSPIDRDGLQKANAHASLDLHIVTFDFEGTRMDTGQAKPFRRTGLVRQTQALIDGLAPILGKLALTQTSAPTNEVYSVRLQNGQLALAQGIQTIFSEPRPFYEDHIDDPQNPLLHSLAKQMANAVRRAGIPTILCQNPNPAVSLLKAEEFGYLDPILAASLAPIFVIHDTAGHERRIDYIKRAMAGSRMNLQVVAVSQQVKAALTDLGIPDAACILNGLNVGGFEALLDYVRHDESIFEHICQRHNLSVDGKFVLVAARRAPHKGHLDIIKSIEILKRRGLDDFGVLFSGATDNPEFQSYEQSIAEEIARLSLGSRIVLLDQVGDLGMAALFDRASASMLVSTEPEGFGYANVEAMLAGTPVIATRLGGPLSYIKHRETGWLVNPGDPGELAEVLIEALDTESELAHGIRQAAKTCARQFTVDAMAQGYCLLLRANTPTLANRVDFSRPFTLVGEGTNALTLARNNKSVVQTFKPNHLSVEQLEAEYQYLCKAYDNMAGFVPRQRFCQQSQSGRLTETLLVKERVHVDRSLQPLHLVDHPDTSISLQMGQFLDITRSLFATPIGSNESMHYHIPDFIDPRFRNLTIDIEGTLRLVDTNWLMNMGSLHEMVAQGGRLDVNQRTKIAAVLRRLMFLENRFRGRTESELREDSFFSQYLSAAGFTTLFQQSEAMGEPFL